MICITSWHDFPDQVMRRILSELGRPIALKDNIAPLGTRW